MKSSPRHSGEKALKQYNRFQKFLILGGLIFLGLFLFFQTVFNPSVPFIMHDSKASWITAPSRVDVNPKKGGNTPWIVFQKKIQRQTKTLSKEILTIKALDQAKLFINNKEIWSQGLKSNWKKASKMDVSAHFVDGENVIYAEVQNPFGPPLLYMHLRGGLQNLATDETWQVGYKGKGGFIQAVIADDTQIHPEARSIKSPFYWFGEKSLMLALFFVISVLIYLFGKALIPEKKQSLLPAAVLAVIGCLWLFLYINRFIHIPVIFSFDWFGHLNYIQFIMINGRIPLANEGWSTFHPPLYYMICAFMANLANIAADQAKPEAYAFIKIISLLSGFGSIVIVYFLSKRIWNKDPLKIALTVLTASVIPMNIYMSAYIGNEPLQAFFVGLAFLFTVIILGPAPVKVSHLALLGVTLGLGALSKVVAIIMIPFSLFFVFLKLYFAEKKSWLSILIRLGGVLAVTLMICGWYYLRNWVTFGTPVMVNWQLPHHMWWQQPGFHTPDYYLSFGEFLRNPFYAGLASFWDGFYSTFWGAGFQGGEKASILKELANPMWNYEYVSVSYLAAVPGCFLILIGLIQGFRFAFTEKDISRRLINFYAVSTVLLFSVIIFYSTLKVPVFTQSKAFYCLSTFAPLSYIFALGILTADNLLNSPVLRFFKPVLYGWLGCFFVVVYLSYMG